MLPMAGVGLFDCGVDGLLVACADGTISRVESRSLVLSEVARLPGPAAWVGRFHYRGKDRSGLLAVIRHEHQARTGWQFTLCRIGFGPITSTRYSPPPLAAEFAPVSAFLLDRRQHLWLGTDAGEWGGWCACIDLATGELTPVKEGEGIAGFVELPDGQVWAFGGLMHMFTCNGFIARVDRGRFEPLAKFPGEWGRGVRRPAGPRFPITHILPDPNGRGLLVFAFADRFRVDSELLRWEYLGVVNLRYTHGRPDAVGSYPALKAVLPALDRAGDLIGVTARDGLTRISDAGVTRHPTGGQLGEETLTDLLPLPRDTVLAGDHSWRYAAGQWEPLPFEPPFPASRERFWSEQRSLLGTEGDLLVVTRDNETPGSVAVTRWRDGHLSTLAGHPHPQWGGFSARSVFAVRGGGLWTTESGRLMRFDGGWRPVGKAPDSALSGLREIGLAGPPWLLCGEGSLFRLRPADGVEEAVLERVSLPGIAKVHDATPLDDVALLLATEGGLRVWNSATGKLTQPSFPLPQGEVTAVGSDRRGRLWLAGASLWVFEKELHSLEAVPLPRGTVLAVGPDAEHDDGVWVSLARRGVLSVRFAPAER